MRQTLAGKLARLLVVLGLVVGWAFSPAFIGIDEARAQSQDKIRILFINPASPEDKYWALVTDVMRAAATDLNVELEVQHAFHNREYTLKHASVAASSGAKPHYVIFRNVGRVAAEVMEITHAAGIKVITIDAPLEKSELDVLGGPRMKYSSWIGQFIPNTLAASQQMVDLLVRTTDQYKVKDARVVIAITGPEQDVGSLMRLRGLQRSLKDITYAKLLHAFPADWSERKADRQAYEAFRYGADAPIWWAADDNMALGVLNMLRSTHRKLGQNTFVGAFNWTEPMMRAIVENKVQYVAGGHFIQGAAALILAHDHHRGRDFVDLGVNHTMALSFLYRKNVSSIGRVVISGLWERIDFRRFSRATNPALAQYDFNVNSYLRAAVGQ